MADGAIDVSAKDEIGEYLAPTRFGKNKPPIRKDKPVARPATRGEALRQIEATYVYNKWDESDKARNARLVGLEAKSLLDYTNDELKIILDDFERYGMIIFEK